MPTILIAYRKADAGESAERLAGLLKAEFGEAAVKLGTKSLLEIGSTYDDSITAGLQAVDVVLLVIGPDWLDPQADKRWLDDERDNDVKMLSMALELEKRVVPVLVDDARVPATDDLPDKLVPLAERVAVILEGESFEQDVAALVTSLKRLLPPAAPAPRSRRPPAPVPSTESRPPAMVEADQKMARADETATPPADKSDPAATARPPVSSPAGPAPWESSRPLDPGSPPPAETPTTPRGFQAAPPPSTPPQSPVQQPYQPAPTLPPQQPPPVGYDPNMPPPPPPTPWGAAPGPQQGPPPGYNPYMQPHPVSQPRPFLQSRGYLLLSGLLVMILAIFMGSMFFWLPWMDTEEVDGNELEQTLAGEQSDVTALEIWLGRDFEEDEDFTLDLYLNFTSEEDVGGLGDVRLLDRTLVLLPVAALFMVLFGLMYMLGRRPSRVITFMMLVLAIMAAVYPLVWATLSNNAFEEDLERTADEFGGSVDEDDMEEFIDLVSDTYSHSLFLVTGFVLVAVTGMLFVASLFAGPGRQQGFASHPSPYAPPPGYGPPPGRF